VSVKVYQTFKLIECYIQATVEFGQMPQASGAVHAFPATALCQC